MGYAEFPAQEHYPDDIAYKTAKTESFYLYIPSERRKNKGSNLETLYAKRDPDKCYGAYQPGYEPQHCRYQSAADNPDNIAEQMHYVTSVNRLFISISQCINIKNPSRPGQARLFR